MTPANPSIRKGSTQQFTATGTYSDSSTQNLTEYGDLELGYAGDGDDQQHGADARSGEQRSQGRRTITATSGSVTGSTALTVTAATLVRSR